MQTIDLAELHARVIIYRDTLKPWKRHAALKAISRLVADGHKSLPSTEALKEAHDAATSGACRSARSDESLMLNWASELPMLPVDLANRILTKAATLADLQIVIKGRPDLARTRLSGAVSSLINLHHRKTGLTAAKMPARLTSVECLLTGFSHTDFALSRESWPSFCSRIRRAVKLVDLSAHNRTPVSHLKPDWRSLVDRINAVAGDRSRRGIRGDLAKIWGLIAHCDRLDIRPDEVSQETLTAFREAKENQNMAGAFDKIRATIYAWQRLQKAVPGFPQRELLRIYADGCERTGRIPFSKLPPSLQADWATFISIHKRKPIDDLSSLVVFPDDLPPLGSIEIADGSISPARLPDMKSTVVSLANAAMNIGARADKLADLIDPTVVQRALQELLQRQQNRNKKHSNKNNSAKNLATIAIGIARLLRVDRQMEARLELLRDHVHPDLIRIDHIGTEIKRRYGEHRMGPRHAERVTEMNDPVKLYTWFNMPDLLEARMKEALRQGGTPTPTIVNDAVACVLHQITRCCPLRRANLAALTIFGPDAWLQLPARDGGNARLLVPAHATKNYKSIEGELSEEATRVVQFYIERFRPALAAAVGADADNPFLFPAAGRRHRSPEGLSSNFSNRNWKVGGIRVNLHVQRHICAKLILDEDPSLMPMVQILLGHKSILTTQRYYANVSTLLAHRKFQEIIEQRRRELERSNCKIRKEQYHAAT